MTHSKPSQRAGQRGVFMIEALVAVLIFSLGVLAMVGTGAVSINAQHDAENRNDAARIADEIAQAIYLHIDLTSPATVASSLGGFAHQASGTGCSFSGANMASVNSEFGPILAKAQALPGANASMQQVLVSSGNFNAVQITLCWKAGSDAQTRQHVYTAYIN